jgi:EXLDI family protein
MLYRLTAADPVGSPPTRFDTYVALYVYSYAQVSIHVGGRYDAPVPNRTIYVSDDDQSLYKRAQELAGGNLSAAISTALKRYVEFADAKDAGFDEVIVKVGIGAGRKVRFSGVLVGEWFNTEGEKFEHTRVWRGPTGKFAVHTESTEHFEMRDAQGNALTGWRAWTGIGMAAGGSRPAVGVIDVYATLEELRDHVRAELYEMVAAAVREPNVEELDI